VEEVSFSSFLFIAFLQAVGNTAYVLVWDHMLILLMPLYRSDLLVVIILL